MLDMQSRVEWSGVERSGAEQNGNATGAAGGLPIEARNIGALTVLETKPVN